jgi:hypothetical protein
MLCTAATEALPVESTSESNYGPFPSLNPTREENAQSEMLIYHSEEAKSG